MCVRECECVGHSHTHSHALTPPANNCQAFQHCPSRWVLPRYWYSKDIRAKSFTVKFIFIDTVILCQVRV